MIGGRGSGLSVSPVRLLRIAHRLEIIQRHRDRTVGAQRAIDLADHEISRACILPGFSSEDLLGDRAPGHLYRTPLKMERHYE